MDMGYTHMLTCSAAGVPGAILNLLIALALVVEGARTSMAEKDVLTLSCPCASSCPFTNCKLFMRKY